ncbi:glycosyltransferase [Pseudomonas sp. NPDC090201]|uniref:glycosyltransferase n=1 Tax=Pseudomonas sp. NPDC090201 TaxID=3364475 RepID=UPI00380AA386
MIGVVIPAHNEENHIHQCVISIIEAANHPDLNGMPVRLVVVLDACTDATEGLAASAGAMVLNVHHKNVGKARGAGAELPYEPGDFVVFQPVCARIFPSLQHAMG